jgi:enoyl-CoA hydratase
MPASEEPVLYSVRDSIAVLTLNRPDAANAQDSALIDALDAALDRADDDDSVRVVVLAANGVHFSAGHDLKELLHPEPGSWAARRETAEDKLRHEQVMYWQRCLRLRDFRKPTIAAVQGKCVAAGLMLACMCDLIVAADDAVFQNPVLRMTGAGVELLVEPWELGIRKAKEFLLTGMEIDAPEAWRLGLANRVVPRDRLLDEALDLAARIALVPPQTAQIMKDSLNNVADQMGQRQSWKYHFMVHQWMSETATAKGALAARKEKGSMRDVYAEHKDP